MGSYSDSVIGFGSLGCVSRISRGTPKIMKYIFTALFGLSVIIGAWAWINGYLKELFIFVVITAVIVDVFVNKSYEEVLDETR